MGNTIRKADQNDAAFIAWAILESSRAGKKIGFFDLIFQSDSDKTLLEQLEKLTVTETKSYCHYSNFLVAEAGGEPIALLCGYEPRIATDTIFAKALAELGIEEDYEERIAAYLLCRPEIDRQTWVLDFIEVKPGHDSFELMKELIQKSLLTARLKGYRKAQTMVEIGSVETKMVYDKLGFTFIDEKRSEYYKEVFGRAGIMRLQMSL